MRFLILFFFILLIYPANSQDINVVDFEVLDKDTIFFSDLPEVDILEFKNNDERNKYFILKKRVLKVYPYALIAKAKIQEIESSLNNISKRRKKKKHIKKVTECIKKEYAEKLKKLTMSEGKILVKLIYRETNSTSYEILKSHRGRFNAFFWQTIAKFWDNNLKTRYDPINVREDMFIEYILVQEKLDQKFK